MLVITSNSVRSIEDEAATSTEVQNLADKEPTLEHETSVELTSSREGSTPCGWRSMGEKDAGTEGINEK
jgi:hypothetical protein